MFFSAAKERLETDTVQNRTARFERLLRETQKPAFNFALRLTGNRTEAEDLVQEAFVRAYRFFDKYDDSLPFTNWLYRILANTHIDLVRRKRRLKTTSLDTSSQDGASSWEIADEDAAADRSIMEQTLDEPVQNALRSIRPEFRTAVLLADLEGMAYEEVADVMKTSVGTVRSRIHRGRKQLREHLLRHSPESARQMSATKGDRNEL
jgi:RNA polymerase sigma-70 factor (ECF subfamily)